uniref:Uncharacterized protein n=1 Tax=Peronospora matthiolae TaxID=2874970 RepID=A0AAV1V948_9STRA
MSCTNAGTTSAPLISTHKPSTPHPPSWPITAFTAPLLRFMLGKHKDVGDGLQSRHRV